VDKNSHHGAAAERHNKHEEPVGNQVHSPHEVAKGNGKTELSKLSIEGVEVGAGMAEELILVTSGVEVDKGVGSGSGQVESLAVDLDGRRLGKHLENVEAGGTGRPGIAENGLVVAVQVGHMRGVIEERKLGSGLVEGLLDIVTSACVCVLVTHQCI
jgi:hypothetical protein